MLCLFASKNRGLDEKQNPRRTYLKLTAVIWGGGGGIPRHRSRGQLRKVGGRKCRPSS